GSPPALTVRGLDNTYAGGFSTTAGSETRVTVNTSTNGGTTAIAAATATISTTVTAVNDAPLITSGGGGATASVSVPENQTAVTDVNATDPDAAAVLTYAIVGGADQGRFTIDVNTGVLSFLVAPDFEAPLDAGANNVYDVTVQVSDGTLTDTQTIAVSVTNVNEAPVNTVPGPQATPEDVPIGIALLVVDPDGDSLNVALSVGSGTLTVSLGGGAAISAGANGTATLTLSGTQAQLNAALATLSYASPANWSGADNLTMTSTDPLALVDTDNVAITVTPVNDAPVPGSNSFTINDGATLAIAAANLSASDIDNPAGTLVFTTGGITHGYFELVAAPGVPVTSFTQQQILNGEVRFVHDGSNLAPTFTISVSDGAAGVGPYAANIVFNGSGFIPPPPPPSGGGGPGGITPLPNPSPLPSPAGAPSDPGGGGFLRGTSGPRDTGGEEGVQSLALQVAQPPAGILKTDRVFVPNMGLPAVRPQMETIETTPQRTEIQVAPLRAELRNEPLPLDEEDRQRIEVVLNSVRISGLAISVGAVWWAARAAGLVASLLSATPAWRHVDPLPVLGRDEEEKEKWDEAEEEDQDKKDEEHRAAWVLEGQEARS
ncbi:MAG: cadherin-like domain-containing protein, partial [Candidatus Rokuibacteriota bacterium]